MSVGFVSSDPLDNLTNVFQRPITILALRNPSTTDLQPINTVWANTSAATAVFFRSAGSGIWIASGTSPSVTASAGNITATNGNLVLSTAGNKLQIATGANASVGKSAAMVAGTITVATTAVTASSLIFLTNSTVGGTVGTLSVGTITAGVSFVINSSSATDTSQVNWLIIN